jgi:hypothetical protein
LENRVDVTHFPSEELRVVGVSPSVSEPPHAEFREGAATQRKRKDESKRVSFSFFDL